MKFEREDWSLFRSVATLCQKAGVPPQHLRRLVDKELVDNALDASGWCTVSRDGGAIVIEDEGVGIDGSPEEIAALLSILRPLASSKLLRLPMRGALGNGSGSSRAPSWHLGAAWRSPRGASG